MLDRVGAGRFGELSECKRIYPNSITAIQIEQQRRLPLAADFEDLRIIAHLTGDEKLQAIVGHNSPASGIAVPERAKTLAIGQRSIDAQFAAHARDVRQAWDAGEPLQRIRDEGLEFVYESVEKPVVVPTVAMIEHGLRVDMQRLEKLAERASAVQTGCNSKSIWLPGAMSA